MSLSIGGVNIEEREVSGLNRMQDKLNFTEETKDDMKIRRWETPEGRKIIAIDSINPNEAAAIRDRLMLESRERIRMELPANESLPEQRAQAVAPENTAIPKVYSNPFGKNLNLARNTLYDPLEEYARLKSKRLPANANDSSTLELLLPFDRARVEP